MRMDSSGLGDYPLWGQEQGKRFFFFFLSRWTFDQEICRECSDQTQQGLLCVNIYLQADNPHTI